MQTRRKLSIPAKAVSRTMTRRRIATAYLEEFDSETLRYARMPGFMLPALLLPSLLYAIFVCLLMPGHDRASDLYWLAHYASFAAIMPGLFAFGISAADERENGYLQFKRALPAPRFAYTGAKLGMSLLTTALSVLLLMLVARATFHALPPGGRAMRLVLVEMFGALPFCALGMLIGSYMNGRSAVGLVNLLLIPLALFSGFLVPWHVLPQWLRAASLLSPGYDLLAVAMASLKPGFPASSAHIVFLLLFATILGALAQWRLRCRG